RRKRRGISIQGSLQNLHGRKPALLSNRASDHVRREKFRQQSSGSDRHLRDRRGGIQVPVRSQRWWFGQQEYALPGNQGALEPGEPREEIGRASCRERV